MTYDETIQFLYSQLPMFSVQGAGAYKPGLRTAMLLDDAFGNGHRGYQTIHVAGTNGKGSTSHALAAVLMAAGYRVGLYTSPHLVDFRERIRVDGEKVSREFVTDFVERYRSMDLDCQPSFFELTTIMAFDYFVRKKVDFAVIETGLGGRLDTTNIIHPVLSVITNVSADHTALLGDSLAQIATEKAGIIKPGVPVVIGEAKGDVRQVFQAAADKAGARIVFAEDTPLPCPQSDLQGSWQAKNLNTVMHAIEALKKADESLRLSVTDEAVASGLSDVTGLTGLMGRWTTLQDSNPRIICDTGHNIGAWQYLGPQLQHVADAQGPLRVVVGFANDKDVQAIFPLLPKNAQYYFVAAAVKRARTSDDLLALAKTHGLHGQAYASVKEGYDKAVDDAREQGTVFVGGSNFVVGEFLLALV